jgi:hypothetical protein
MARPVASEFVAAGRRPRIGSTESEEAMTSLGKWLMVLTLALVPVLVSCRRSPIYNVNNSPITTPKRVTLSDVRGAIERAGHGLGWQMESTGPGHIVATLYLRSHMAQVDIPYTTTSFSITYRDSKDLNYDGSNIHSNYNNWIRNLDQAIQQQLATL